MICRKARVKIKLQSCISTSGVGEMYLVRSNEEAIGGVGLAAPLIRANETSSKVRVLIPRCMVPYIRVGSFNMICTEDDRGTVKKGPGNDVDPGVSPD